MKGLRNKELWYLTYTWVDFLSIGQLEVQALLDNADWSLIAAELLGHLHYHSHVELLLGVAYIDWTPSNRSSIHLRLTSLKWKDILLATVSAVVYSWIRISLSCSRVMSAVVGGVEFLCIQQGLPRSSFGSIDSSIACRSPIGNLLLTFISIEDITLIIPTFSIMQYILEIQFFIVDLIFVL